VPESETAPVAVHVPVTVDVIGSKTPSSRSVTPCGAVAPAPAEAANAASAANMGKYVRAFIVVSFGSRSPGAIG